MKRDESNLSGSRKLPDEESYCCPITVRLRPSQYRAAEREARRRGHAVGRMIREILVEELGI